MDTAVEIGMLLFPNFTQLDLTGPFEVLSRVPGARIHLISKSLDPVRADSGLLLIPSTTFDACPKLDILFVPGGPGQVEVMDDLEALDFLARRGAEARYITSVCTGSLLLAAAGLLDGFRAACHWMSRDQLAQLGVQVSADRVCIDRNRITGGGVTAGIDFGLTLAAIIAGEDVARRIQLQLEYNPSPPFDSGSPDSAGVELIAAVQRHASPLRKARAAATERVRSRRQIR